MLGAGGGFVGHRRSIVEESHSWERIAPKLISPDGIPVILGLDSPLATLERVGGKGASLARMVAAGLPGPPVWLLTWAARFRMAAS